MFHHEHEDMENACNINKCKIVICVSMAATELELNGSKMNRVKSTCILKRSNGCDHRVNRVKITRISKRFYLCHHRMNRVTVIGIL